MSVIIDMELCLESTFNKIFISGHHILNLTVLFMPPKQKNKPLSNQKSFKDLLTSFVHSQHNPPPKQLKVATP